MFADVTTWLSNLSNVCEELQQSLRGSERQQEKLRKSEEGDDQQKGKELDCINEKGRDEGRRDDDKLVTLKTNDRISGRNNWTR